VKSPTLAVPEHLWEALTGWLADDREVAGVLLARIIDDEAGTTMLARDLRPAASESYLDRRTQGQPIGSTI